MFKTGGLTLLWEAGLIIYIYFFNRKDRKGAFCIPAVFSYKGYRNIFNTGVQVLKPTLLLSASFHFVITANSGLNSRELPCRLEQERSCLLI
jgi:hypothetical protein